VQSSFRATRIVWYKALSQERRYFHFVVKWSETVPDDFETRSFGGVFPLRDDVVDVALRESLAEICRPLSPPRPRGDSQQSRGRFDRVVYFRFEEVSSHADTFLGDIDFEKHGVKSIENGGFLLVHVDVFRNDLLEDHQELQAKSRKRCKMERVGHLSK
jgi:hypothetical protein